MKVNRHAQQVVQSLPDSAALQAFLTAWLNRLTEEQQLTQMGARAVFRAAGLLDEGVWRAFEQINSQETGLRLTTYDLLAQMADFPMGESIPAVDQKQAFPWALFLLSAFARKNGYDVQQFDAASPPNPHTPAGLVLQQAFQMVRIQTERSATERDRLARQLAYSGQTAFVQADQADESPSRPLVRPMVPVRYPEFNPDVQISTDDLNNRAPAAPAQRRPEIKITPEDLPVTIHVPRSQPAPPRPARRQPSTPSSFRQALRDLFRNERLKTTRLRVLVQEYPDGPGLYGLQVSVTSRSIKSFVAGTTDRQGRFLCELPVRLTSGLTYDIDVTWPADLGGHTERKTITINADRTEFNLPFYRRLNR